MKIESVARAIRDGAATASEIARHPAVSPSDRSHVSRELKKFAETGDLDRYDRAHGPGYVYDLPEPDPEDADVELPILGDREYDWQQLVPPPDTQSYVPAGDELVEIEAVVDGRSRTGQLPRVRVGGPPGTGKTTLAAALAAERRWPYIEVQMTASMREPDLVGAPQLVGGETMWADGPLTRALLCSQDRPVLLCLDEVNRATPGTKTVLMSALDYRARVIIKSLGNDIVEGSAENLVVVSTMNEGADFETWDLDPAEKRRLGNMWYIPYLGLVDLEREAQLVADQSPASMRLARRLVFAANEVRLAADDDHNREIRAGVPASAVIRWAQTATSYQNAGLDDPLERAAQSAIVDSLYDDRSASTVEQLLVDGLDQADGHDQISSPVPS